MKKIILIDGNSLMFRSYYATAYSNNLMKNKQGLYTNAIYGFCNMLMKLQEETKTHIFVAFDAGKKTFRHQQYTEYKGTRKQLPDELCMQIPYIKKYLDIINVKRFETFDYEADDLIATMATLAVKNGFDEVMVVSGDKDLLQLVHDPVKVFINRKGATELEEFNEHNFYEKMNIYPYQVPDYKGLVGDPSDNLPGIKGIGDKTAVKLLNDFKTLETIIANLSLLKGKTKEVIEGGYKTGLQCKGLATLKKDIELEFTIDDTMVKDYNVGELEKFYRELEFDSLLKKINTAQVTVSDDVDIIDDDQYDFSSLKEVTILPEVLGTNYYNGELLGIGLLDDEHQLFIKPHVIFNNQSFHQLLSDGHFNTFDYKKLYVVLKKHSLSIPHVSFDVLLASYLINPSYANDDVKRVTDEFIKSNINYDETIYGSKNKTIIPDMHVLAHHCLSKCQVIKSLIPELKQKIKDNEQEQLLTIEMNLSPVLGDMELDGLKVDRHKLEEVECEFEQMQSEIAQKIYAIVGDTFNINSVKQLGEILFERLGLPSGKKNKTGYSTSSDVLEKLAPKYEIARLILEYRGIAKLISTYIKGLYEVMNDTNFVHPLYKQALTATGRLSSIEPNIQNMPIRTELGQVIREAFISRFPKGLILSCDYSQIELRILAHLSNDETMISMFNAHIDFHKQTAGEMYDVPLDEVTKDMRRTAKAINFGIIYGMSAWGLSETIKITPQDATKYINKYFETFKEVKTFLDKTISDAKKNGYTKTLFNRIRYMPELYSENKVLASFGERTAMNSPIQGSAADIIKLAMIKVKDQIKGLKSKMIAQVHDELVFDVHPDEINLMMKLVKESMESVVNLKVPMIAEASSGENWLKA